MPTGTCRHASAGDPLALERAKAETAAKHQPRLERGAAPGPFADLGVACTDSF